MLNSPSFLLVINKIVCNRMSPAAKHDHTVVQYPSLTHHGGLLSTSSQQLDQ